MRIGVVKNTDEDWCCTENRLVLVLVQKTDLDWCLYRTQLCIDACIEHRSVLMLV